jgi:ParB-like chromosome segregation protein Spo0J
VVSQVLAVDELPLPVVSVEVRDLIIDTSFRSSGMCAEHVERLVEAGGSWPPVLVGRVDNVVIDGAHRVMAARRLGLVRLDAVLFDGGRDDAFVEFVRRNVSNGLVLTLAERKLAAERILAAHCSWSDRRVAELCALSPKTVGRVRATSCPIEEDPHSDSARREGRDRRLRPLRRGPVRARVVEALQARPDASLRAIAAEVGVSPETVRSVRLALADVAEVDREGECSDSTSAAPPWREDAALASSEHGEHFVTWFERTAVGLEDLEWVPHVPLSRVYEIADEARRRSDTWLRFARVLETRSGRR